MIHAWRLVREARARDAFTGEGARLYGGRWNPVGLRVTYLSESRSLAALEALVHQTERLPTGRFLFFEIKFPEHLVKTLSPGDLEGNWRSFPPPRTTVTRGGEWLKASESPLLRVPSVLIPEESNYLFNPSHPDAHKIVIGSPRAFSFDPRFS